jgi:hypothetical protein
LSVSIVSKRRQLDNGNCTKTLYDAKEVRMGADEKYIEEGSLVREVREERA